MYRLRALWGVTALFLFHPLSLEAYLLLPQGGGWPQDHLTVEYYINEDGDPYCYYGDEFEAVQKGIQAWTDVSTSKIRFVYIGKTVRKPDTGTVTRDIYNVVGWIQSDWAGYKPPLVSAFASILWKYEGGPLKTVDMLFNGQYQNWSAEEGNTCPSWCYDVQDVATHESGHWIDLDNLTGDNNADKTMFGNVYMGEVDDRTLHSDDIAGASFLYPYEADWDDAVQPVAVVEPLNLHVDVALAWDPVEASEDFHLACQEGYQFEGLFPDTAIPFESVVSPVRVVYTNSSMGLNNWDILSPYFQRIYVPQLEISNNIVRI